MDDFHADVEIDQNNLSLMFMRHAGLAAFYGAEHAKAAFQENRIKLRLEVEAAKLSKEIRERLLAEGGKSTEKQIEAELMTTPSYIKLVQLHLEAKAKTHLLSTAVDAFKQRRDMLVQLGAQARDEMKGEMRMSGSYPKEGLRAAFEREIQ